MRDQERYTRLVKELIGHAAEEPFPQTGVAIPA
jgi:hypothetical protein